MPRALRKVLEKARAPKPVVLTQKEPQLPPQKRVFETPDPTKYSLHSQKLHKGLVESIEKDQPHFPIGGKEVWFPWVPITLLPPSARMTPYQAQFQVPLNFNKLDMRDYLWHVYGLRALNITTQIKHSRWALAMPRYRTSQVKKMIIDMEAPFVWPELDPVTKKLHRVEAEDVMRKYDEVMRERVGSDMKKPVDEVADGILGPFPEAPQGFVSKALKQKLENTKSKSEKAHTKREQESLLATYLKL